ncbi:MAG: putative metal-binding motif-containing protein [Myxococcales bacterium]|nr:putative metal-binding motif-containing protein [Myxococcales bacterium]
MTHRHPLLALALAALTLPLLGCTKTRRCSEIGLIENLDGICECAPPRVIAPGDRLRCDCPEGWDDVDGVCIPPDGGVDGGPVEDGCVPRTVFADADGDGRGDPAVSTEACVTPEGYVDNADDCDDTCAVCWTGAEEVCDGEDNDCNGHVDEGVRVPVGEPVQINTDRALSGALTNGLAVEPLPDGGALAFFIDDSLDDVLSYGQVTMVRLDGEGRPVGAAIHVDPSVHPQSFVTSTRNGDAIVVAYASDDGSVRARVYSAADGSALTPPRVLTERWARDIAVTSYGSGFIFAWTQEDRFIVVQSRQRLIGNAPEDGDVLHELSESLYLHPMSWVEVGPSRWLVFRDGDVLRSATFEGALSLPLPTATPLAVEASNVQFLRGGPNRRVGISDLHGGLAAFDVTSPALEVIVADAALYGPPWFSAAGDLVAVSRLSTDLDSGAMLYGRTNGEWQRAIAGNLAPPTFGPLIVNSLVVFSEPRDDVTANLTVRRLGCE